MQQASRLAATTRDLGTQIFYLGTGSSRNQRRSEMDRLKFGLSALVLALTSLNALAQETTCGTRFANITT